MDLTLSQQPRPGIGELAPWFNTRCGEIQQFHLSSLGGRHVILCFPGIDKAAGTTAMAMLAEWVKGVHDRHCIGFGVMQPDDAVASQALWPHLRVFQEMPGMAITRAYGIGAEGGWVVIDTLMRIMMRAPLSAGAELLARVRRLPLAGLAGPADAPAPVLVLPGVFEPEFCQHLIALYQADGGEDSGYMREQNGKTVGVIDHNFKRRRDMLITDPDVMAQARIRMEQRLLPMLTRALQFTATRMERYIVACYDAQERGFFRAHRDNTTRGTAHRRFAITINLNAEEFEGGELCFPEFGPRTYRAPTGGAVAFSCSLLHEARPVTKGVRYAFLPFLYDEEGAKVRAANLGFLADPQNRGYNASSQRTS
ncbi:2OG-Fe(II) oxygenase [Niveispirillum sp.]|uniref:2OG-Fe(II) oxygenase n=1 Tax=Niveispirillum sp. TaxID=1917217 RepID=UPI001B5CC853|nr:2OG-Fe(II) oxygenase [Niveispirillum sp.]MBP7338637.1 2OG-Fe(II) oxygenase [Niveispirillum sp.]